MGEIRTEHHNQKLTKNPSSQEATRLEGISAFPKPTDLTEFPSLGDKNGEIVKLKSTAIETLKKLNGLQLANYEYQLTKGFGLDNNNYYDDLTKEILLKTIQDLVDQYEPEERDNYSRFQNEKVIPEMREEALELRQKTINYLNELRISTKEEIKDKLPIRITKSNHEQSESNEDEIVINPRELTFMLSNLKGGIRHERSHEVYRNLSYEQKKKICDNFSADELKKYLQKGSRNEIQEDLKNHFAFDATIKKGFGSEKLSSIKYSLDSCFKDIQSAPDRSRVKDKIKFLKTLATYYIEPISIDGMIMDKNRVVDAFLAEQRQRWRPGDKHWLEIIK